ncbi:tRNA-2-methylthio-N(6)-dimethylallyladenosine synthase [Pontiella desulfatans]|uniref:tRNA-2-methylthio-N(6)-dimethylallyladenosine synthase n=1 Tax=Pontiella desulfatans TaxID=2750659 RepID=A0A6C2U2R8_PONDE|nr:tRNA (N6-isopentenyl adenosine(37)-C2)-methylthiotransferase MiaB [Pontiella desulfatans]VGO14292.1 tRNA-2-methylthio-N(6)-dimethylallyladenosine synthase [Pontiella desulfatans]
MKCCVVTLGCQMNQSDSERIRSVIEGMGYEMTSVEEEATLIGVVACSVRQKAIDKVYSKIQKWNQWKNKKPLVTFVSGCILPADEKKFLKLFDLVFRMNELPELPDMLHQCGVATEFSAMHPLNDLHREDERTDFWQVDPTYSSEFEAFVPIQNGCDKFCSYCAVPYTRGREVSRASDDILAEVKKLVERDVKAITLLGQNVNSYGLDKKGEEISFAELLRKVGELGQRSGKDFWLYFTSPHPRDMTRDVIEAIADYDCLAKQIHLPVQSGDEKLLRRMNRNHSIEDYLKIVDDIRELLPTATIFTDIIVGFSGETDEQLENSAALMERVKFNMAYIAKYSPRVGARSARWEDDISPQVKSERLARLSDVLKRTSLAHNEAMVGKVYRVLIDGRDRRVDGALTGRTEGKLPVRVLDGSEDRVGTICDVEITSVAELSLTGRIRQVR